MHHKRIKYITVFLLSSFTTLSAITLKESINLAIDKNPNILYYENETNSANEEYKEIDSENYPTINFNGKLVKNRINSNTTSNKSESGSPTNYSLGVKQNIFNGLSTTNRLKSQEDIIKAANFDYKNSMNDISFKVITAYFSILKNKKLLQIEKDNIKVITNIFNEISESHKSGFAILSDVKKVEAALQNAEYNLLVQENQLKDWISMLEYHILRKVKPDEIEEEKSVFKVPTSLEAALNQAYENNPKILSALNNVNAQHSKYKASQSWKYPSLDFVAEKSKTGDSGTSYGTTDQMQYYLNLDYKFSLGGEGKHKEKKQLIELSKYKNNLSSIQNKIKFDVTKVWTNMTILNEQKSNLEYYYIHSSSTIDLYKQEFEIGERKLLDLLVAQKEYISSNRNLVSANYDIDLLKYELMYLTNDFNKPDNHIPEKIEAVKIENKKMMVLPKQEIENEFEELVYSNSYKEMLLDPKNKDKYLINLAVYSKNSNLDRLVNNHNLSDSSYAYKIENTNLKKLVYGIYDTKESAKKALSKYIKSKDINSNSPYVTKIKVTQEFLSKMIK